MTYHPEQRDDEIFMGFRRESERPNWISTRFGNEIIKEEMKPCFVSKKEVTESADALSAGEDTTLRHMIEVGASSCVMSTLPIDKVVDALYPLAGNLESLTAKVLLARYQEITGKERPGFL